ncbi:tetratricopeptide repeat protein [Rugosimonospora africana]|uniref:tetratricopeptide repeat protein n=1 Tax=Rugosimonospora africana TaxID=556532 RepID=UPI0019410440|nr:tetratricopeptide repeat protein [Rugosimonospora africana]
MIAGVAAVAGAFAPSVMDWVRSRGLAADRQVRALRESLVADLPRSAVWLLHPDVGVVRFFGRGWELAQLDLWCQDPDAGVVRLICAGAGMGKTRLARQFAARLDGWQVWPVAAGQETLVASRIAGGETPKLLLVVVDYAETREPVGLATLLCAAARCPANVGRVRVLLVARSVGPWWSSLSGAYPQQAALMDSLTVERHVIQLGARADDRRPEQVVADAVEEFAAFLHRRVPTALSGVPYPADTPLLRLHAEALVALLGGPRSDDGRHDVLDEVLGHERRYWRGCARRAGLTPPGPAHRADTVLRDLVGIAALVGAGDDGEMAGVVRRVPALAGADETSVDEWMHWLRELYPAPSGRPERLGTLQPDLLAEHLAVAVLMEWTEAQRIAAFVGLAEGQAVQTLTVLGRAAAWQPAATTLIDAALVADPSVIGSAAIRVARQFPSLLPGRLAAFFSTANIDPKELRRLAQQVPFPSMELHSVALALTSRIVMAGSTTASASDRGLWLNSHALRLAEAGRRDEALSASKEAVSVRQELVAGNRADHLADLASSLNNYANRLAAVGRRREALTISGEALAVYRELAADNPNAHLPDLAGSLNNYAIRLAEAGRRDEALSASDEALALWRELAAGDRDAYLSDLAMSLGNYANCLAEAELRAEALTTNKETVALYRELAADNPDAHLPSLTKSLNNYANCLAYVGRRDEALTTSEEAVALQRKLAARNRNAQLPELAMSVSNHALYLGAVGRLDEALTTSEEAVALYRELAADNRDAHLPDLAMSVSNYANQLAAVRRQDEALATSEEAVALYRKLAADNRDAHLPDLAGTLNNHAISLAGSGRREEALTTSEEAVALRRKLAARDRVAHLPGLAKTLCGAGSVCLLVDGPMELALASCSEGLGYFEELERKHPGAFTEQLRAAIEMLAYIHHGLNNFEAAIALRARLEL